MRGGAEMHGSSTNKIDIELDRKARILTIRIVGEVTDERALREIPRIWRDHPEVRDCDSIIDLTRDHGAITWDAVTEIANKWHAFAGAADIGRRTAVVVRNALWETIVSVIAMRFPRRRFDAFRTIDDARRWLEAPAEQPQATSPQPAPAAGLDQP